MSSALSGMILEITKQPNNVNWLPSKKEGKHGEGQERRKGSMAKEQSKLGPEVEKGKLERGRAGRPSICFTKKHSDAEEQLLRWRKPHRVGDLKAGERQ